MKLFLFKSFCLVSLMFLFASAGIYKANEGINKLTGKQDLQFRDSLIFQQQDNIRQPEMDHSGHDLSAKQQKLEKMNALNFFSSTGEIFSEAITKAANKVIHSIFK